MEWQRAAFATSSKKQRASKASSQPRKSSATSRQPAKVEYLDSRGQALPALGVGALPGQPAYLGAWLLYEYAYTHKQFDATSHPNPIPLTGLLVRLRSDARHEGNLLHEPDRQLRLAITAIAHLQPATASVGSRCPTLRLLSLLLLFSSSSLPSLLDWTASTAIVLAAF